MKIQHKALLLVALTTGVLTLSSALVSRQSISASFSELEHRQAQVEATRARRILDQQLADLAATAMDYAYWVDTAEFAQGRMPDYFGDNFGVENMKYLRMSQVLVLDALGRPIDGAAMGEGETLEPLEPAMSQALRSLAVPVLSDASSETVVRTYHRMGESLYLVVIAAVRSQFAPGTEPKGALVMVRAFDTRELSRFSEILMHPVRLVMPTTRPTIGPAPANDAPDVLLARSPVADGDGHVVAELLLSLPRDVRAHGQGLALAAAVQVAVAGLLLGAVLLVALNVLFIRRLARVHRELKVISAQGLEGTAQLEVTGHDELSGLARGINALLERVRADSARQIEAHARQEALHLQLLHSQKNEALGRFAGGIAHDFSNSLAAASGCVMLAREDVEPHHPGRPALDKALESLQYGKGLIRQLLSFGRQVAPKAERLRLGVVVSETCDLVSLGLLKGCQLRLDVQTDDDWVQADPTQVKQVIVNLLINASDAMDGQGVISLTVSARRLHGEAQVGEHLRLPAGRYLSLTVQDTGPGIAPDHVSRIFEPFFTTKAQEKGTGLGLSVVHGIVARHGGAITVVSVPGAGACFEVLLPQAEAFEPAATGGPPPLAGAPRAVNHVPMKTPGEPGVEEAGAGEGNRTLV